MTNKGIVIIVFAIGIILQCLAHYHTSTDFLYALSASFPNQQFEVTRNVTQNCPSNQANISKSLANDIVGVTYSSDGQNMVLTVWFKDVIMLRNNQSLQGKQVIAHIPPERVVVHGDGRYQDMRNAVEKTAALENKTLPEVALEEIAAFYNETIPEGADQLHLSQNGDKASLNIENDAKESGQIYAKLELNNLSSSDLYTLVDILDVLGVNSTYEALGNDLVKSYFQEYRMFIDIKSIYDTGWDYVADLVWNDTGDKWSYTMGQYDPSAPMGEPGKEIPNPPPAIHRNFIDNTINMSALKYPSDMWVMFQMQNTIVTESGSCEFYDRTELIPVPPPRLRLQANPESLQLIPGERGRIQLTVNSSTNIGANIHFDVANKSGIRKTGIDIVRGPSPEDIAIPARSLATSELEVRPIAKNDSYTSLLRPFANVSFLTPVQVGKYGNETTSLVHLIIDSEIPVSVERAKGPIEQMAEGFDNTKVFVEKVSGVVAAIAIIVGAGGIGGFVAFLRKIRRRKTKTESVKDDQLRSKQGSGAPF